MNTPLAYILLMLSVLAALTISGRSLESFICDKEPRTNFIHSIVIGECGLRFGDHTVSGQPGTMSGLVQPRYDSTYGVVVMRPSHE